MMIQKILTPLKSSGHGLYESNKQDNVRIAMVAGEASGDLLASHLIIALKRHLPDTEFYGIGGAKMQASGFNALYPAEKLAVHGYIEALKHYAEIAGIRRKLAKNLLAHPPHIFIGVDAPDFNLDLERTLKRRGIPSIHYVSPSVWAWRGGRIAKIARSVSHLLALFPFEEKIYRQHEVPVSYVGHPLADIIPVTVNRSAARSRLNLDQDQLVFALLPGSRQAELLHLGETFIETAKLLALRFPRAKFLLPLATQETRALFEKMRYQYHAAHLPIVSLFGHAHDALEAADAALVASGTATLEAALFKCPMVIAYKLAPWSYRIMSRMRYQAYVGLPNILSGRFIVPEFLQDEARPENLAQALGNLAEDKQMLKYLTQCFTKMHIALKQNTAEKAASAILPYLQLTR